MPEPGWFERQSKSVSEEVAAWPAHMRRAAGLEDNMAENRAGVVPDYCAHDFVYLRQERKNIGYDRNPTWLVEDVFYCKKCLQYKRAAVEKRTPRTDSFDEHVERLV